MSNDTEMDPATEALVQIMEDADVLLARFGVEISEDMDAPEDFIEAVAQVLDENDLDEETEETLCLGIALIESILDEEDALEEDDDSEQDEPLDERNLRQKKNLTWRRGMDPLHGRIFRKYGKGATTDPLASKENGEVLAAYNDKRNRLKLSKGDVTPQRVARAG